MELDLLAPELHPDLLPSCRWPPDGASARRLGGQRRWLGVATGGAAALLFCLAVLSSVVARKNAGAPVLLGQEFHEFEDWEALPDIIELKEHAANLWPPLRKLSAPQPFASDPKILGRQRAQCVIDVSQTTAYLGQAVVMIYRAKKSSMGARCPDATASGCANSIATIVNSFIWMAAYLTLAASTCAESVNTDSLCVSDFTSIAANVGEMASSGAGMFGDCNFPGWSLPPWLAKLQTLQKPAWVPPPWLTTPQPEAEPETTEAPQLAEPEEPDEAELLSNATKMQHIAYALAKIQRRIEAYKNKTKALVDEAKSLIENDIETKVNITKDMMNKTKNAIQQWNDAVDKQTERNFNIAQCAFDNAQWGSYTVRAILQIQDATKDCTDPRQCAIDILDVLSSFAWIAEQVSFAFVDCPVDAYQHAACSADISDMVAAIASFGACALDAVNVCAVKS